MITLHRSGIYKLIETRRNVRILYLDKTAYAWVAPWSTKEILVLSRRPHVTDCILSVGDYCLYDLRDEPSLPGKQFLELDVGDDIWQGYMLLTGLPTTRHKRVRIIPTRDYVTNNPVYSYTGLKFTERMKRKSKGGEHEVAHSV